MIHCTEDAIRLAKRRLPRLIYDFVAGGAGRETATELNQSALNDIRLRPRILANVENRSLETGFLGETFGLPFGISPMGMCNLSWPNADRFLARVAVEQRIPICLSSAASTSIESMARQSEGHAWFQLYVSDDMKSVFKLVDRAREAGYETLVLTVDVPQVSIRIRDLRNGFTVPFQLGPRQLWDFATHPRWTLATLLNGVPKPMNYLNEDGSSRFNRDASRARCDWAFLARLRRYWGGRLVLKGVMDGADARRASEYGVDALYVSNHGGRQLDSVPPAILTLPLIRRAVGKNFPLIFDSGIRNGEDVVRALALGADYVMLGRPLLYALGAEGEAGLKNLVSTFTREISVVMAQLGLTRISQINNQALAPVQIGACNQMLAEV